MSEITHATSESLGDGLIYRVHIDSGHPLEKYGFLPGANINVIWTDGDGFTVSTTPEPTLNSVWESLAFNVDLPPHLQNEGEIQFQLEWSPGRIVGSSTQIGEISYSNVDEDDQDAYGDFEEELEEEELEEEELEEEELEEEEALPTQRELREPTLNALRKLGGDAHIRDIESEIARQLRLGDKQLSIPRPGDSRTQFQYHAAWARTQLRELGKIESASTGTWRLTDNRSKTTEFENQELMTQLRDVIERTDNSRSSNTKYKIPPPGSDYSVRQLIAEFLEMDEDGVYIVGVTTRFHNLRKNLLQSTQNEHKIAVGIYMGEDWMDQTLERYVNDQKISDNFKEGILFFCLSGGVLDFTGASLTSDKYESKLRPLGQDAVIRVHKPSNALAGKLGHLARIMEGQTIISARSEYHCSLVNEFFVVFDETDRTGKIMLPTDLVMEWIEAMEDGVINTSMSARRCRRIVSKNSVWATQLHTFETHLKAIANHWQSSKVK